MGEEGTERCAGLIKAFHQAMIAESERETYKINDLITALARIAAGTIVMSCDSPGECEQGKAEYLELLRNTIDEMIARRPGKRAWADVN